MLATIIIAIIVAIAIVIFAVKAANIKNAIKDIYGRQAILHEKYCNHEYRINGNYKSLAELSRRQDELEKVGNGRHCDVNIATDELREAIDELQKCIDSRFCRNSNEHVEFSRQIRALQGYNAEKEERAREAVEEFKQTMNCIAVIAQKQAKKAVKAKGTSKASDTPATGRQETRDAKQTTQANREHFAELRKTMSVREAGEQVGVSLTTAKRYEKWCKAQEQ